MLNDALNGKILNVRLTSGAIEPEVIPEETYRKYLGGYGLGARLIFDRIPKGADALGPDNVLGFFPGLLTGTPLFGIRYQVVTKSPKNNGWGDANCGGDFGPYLKHAGWDGLMLYGKAEKPVYILIQDDKVEIKDASSLWGMLAIDVELKLKEQYGKKASIACIGPAGETLSHMAGICNERGRLAARSGVGAVMGSKNVKAIVCLASKNILAGDRKDVKLMVRESLDQFVAPLASFFRNYGTTGITAGSAMSGDSPVKNWGGAGVTDFPGAVSLMGDKFNEKMDKKYGCWHCPLACGAESHGWDEHETKAHERIAKRADERSKLQAELTDAGEEVATPLREAIAKLDAADENDGKIKNDPRYPYPHHTHRAEYEAAAAFGTMNLMGDINALQYANHLCNQYGFDVIAAGGTVSMAFECFENGLITKEDTEGVELKWGDVDAVIHMLNLLGRREGRAGEIFADGVKLAAERLGGKADQYAMHIAGEELPMHDPKLQPEYYTTYKLDPTPARHTQYEGAARAGWGVAPGVRDRAVAEGRGQHHKDASEYMHVVNSAGMCQFIMMAGPNDRIPEWINLTTGWDTTPEEIKLAGERIGNLRMAFSVREGDIVTKRKVPGRVLGTPALEAGPHKDVTLDAETLEREFLLAADWDVGTATPSRKKLEELGLKDVAEAIGAK